MIPVSLLVQHLKWDQRDVIAERCTVRRCCWQAGCLVAGLSSCKPLCEQSSVIINLPDCGRSKCLSIKSQLTDRIEGKSTLFSARTTNTQINGSSLGLAGTSFHLHSPPHCCNMKSMEPLIICACAAIFFLYTSNLTNQTEGNIRRPSREHVWSDQLRDEIMAAE